MRARLTNSTVAKLTPRDKPYEVNDIELIGFLLRVQPTGVMTYYSAYRLADGRKNRKRIGRHGTLTPMQARDEAKKILAKVTTGQNPKSERGKVFTLASFLDLKYGPHIETHNKVGKQTLERIRASFAGLLGRRLDQITPWSIDMWRKTRLKAGTGPATVNRDVGALRAALSKAVEWKLLNVHPLAEVKPLKVEERDHVRFLDEDEEQRLREALDSREERLIKLRDAGNAWRRERRYAELPDRQTVTFADYFKPLVLVAINTGLRRGELFDLQWSNIDLKSAVLTVAWHTAKTGRTRHVPLNAEALDVLRAWKLQNAGGDGLVFPSRDGGRFVHVKGTWRSVRKAAELERFRFHDLRHHFASRLVMSGVNLYVVKELLGHSTIEMTERYAHLAAEHKAEAVSRLVRS
jgi:integrase